MKTLKEQFKNIFKDSPRWDYYYGKEKPIDNFSIDYLSDSNRCYHFIYSYMHRSQKDAEPFVDYLLALANDEKEDIRLCHIVSTFFLGLVLYQNKYIKDFINKEIMGLKVFETEDEIEKEFIFVWYLVCLYHDLGYVYEKQITNDRITKDYIEYKKKLLTETILFIDKDSTPDYYSEIIDKYLKYRGGKDHGILGGLEFTKYITELRFRKYDEAEDEHSKKEWKPELDKLYKYVGWCICCHNVWYRRCENNNVCDVLEYIAKGLNPLVFSGRKEEGKYVEYPLKFQDFPLFFLFCLVDSIEPSKLCSKQEEVCDVLDKIKIEVSDTGLVKFDISQLPNNEGYIKKSLNSWLVSVEYDNSFQI